jgi:tetratricopeptide (TPR) repeat protein
VLRTDDNLLAHLIIRRNPSVRPSVRAALKRQTDSDSDERSVAARSLMKAKLLAPTEYVSLKELIAEARRKCAGCGRAFVAFAGKKERRVRCGRCGKATQVPAFNGPGPPPARSSRSKKKRADVPHAAGGAGGRDAPRAADASTRRDPPAAEAGVRVGPYAIESTIAKGGMGIVYRAYDTRSKRRVALKVLRGDASVEIAERFKREAEAIARLRHAAIVQVHDVGLDGRQRWFTMDLIEGKDLERALLDGEIDRRGLARLMAEVAEGLEHAHERGIIHRDVKPQNILVELGSGSAKLTDFGLARDLARSALTEEGDLIGTPYYMAPEQLEGEPADRRTDVYALGLVLYRGLAGSLPFEARSIFELKEKVLREAPAPPSLRRPETPPELDRICRKAIEKAPADRYPTAAAFARDLRAWLKGEEVLARPVTPIVRAGRVVHRFRALLGALAAILVVTGGGYTVYDARRRASDEAVTKALAEAEALGTTNTELARAGLELEEGRVSLARGEGTAARMRFEKALEAVAKARAALGGAPAEVRPQLETRARASERAARRARVEARLTVERGGHVAAEMLGLAREEVNALIAEDGHDAEALLLLGRVELEGDRLGPAAVALGKAIDIAPSRLDAYYLRGESYRRAKRAEFARMDFARALGEDPVDPVGRASRPPAEGGRDAHPTENGASLRVYGRDEVLVARARARLQENDREGAERDLDEAARIAPRSPLVHLARAEREQASGNLEGALSELSLACGLAPGRADLLRERGLVEAALGDRPGALADLTRAIELDSGDRSARAARARLRALALDVDGADEDLALALPVREGEPQDQPALQQARLVAARLRRTEGNLDAALSYLDPVIKLPASPATTAAHLERAELLVERHAGDDLKDAIPEIELALAAGPRNPRALLAAARLALATGERGARASSRALDQARGHLESLRDDLGALDSVGHALLARVLREQTSSGGAETQQAADELAKAATLEREEARVIPLLGVGSPEDEARELASFGQRALARGVAGGSVERAYRAFKTAAALAPELATVRLGLARSLRLKGQLDDALHELDRALAETPPLFEFQVERAEILLAKGELDQPAIDAFGTALDMVPKDDAHAAVRATIFLERGGALLRGGDPRRALPDLDQACALDPISLEAFRARALALEKVSEAELAAKDKERVALLGGGYKDEVRRVLRECEELRSKARHRDAAKLLEALFAIVPRSDPRGRASLYYSRANFTVRDLQVGRAFADLAGMIELDTGRWKDMFDEVMELPDTIKIDAIVAEARGVVRDREPDPDFFGGFEAFVRLEFSSEYANADKRRAEARRGILSVTRFLDRSPLHPSALTLRAFLETAAGFNGAAIRDARAALEVATPLGAAQYALFRVDLARHEMDAALGHLEAALRERFLAWNLIERDLGKEPPPRFRRAIALAKGRDALATMDRIPEVLKRAGAEEERGVLETALNIASAGLSALRALVQSGDPDAFELAGALRLARSRCARRLGDPVGAARDLVASIELSPAALARNWKEVLAEAAELARFSGTWDSTLAPPPGDPTPSPAFEQVGRDVVLALGGQKLRFHPGSEPAARPSLLVARSILALAGGDAEGALKLATDPRVATAAPLTSLLLAARAEATRGRNEDAISLLEKAKAGGVRGADLKHDPVLAEFLGKDPSYRRLTEE